MGEFLYFFVYVVQQLGVMLGVGAQTVLLCTHLVAVHRAEVESSGASYARAARLALGAGLALMVLSGAAAIVLHVLSGQIAIVLAPAFLFKWALIAGLFCAYFFERHFFSSNIFYAITGATWYALFLVHSLGPVASWATLGTLYGAWLVVFAATWGCFVALMHWRRIPSAQPMRAPTAVQKEITKVVPKVVPILKPVVAVAPPPPKLPPQPKIEEPVIITINSAPRKSLWQRLLALLPKRKPAPYVPLPVVPPVPTVVKLTPPPAPVPPAVIAPTIVIAKPEPLLPAPPVPMVSPVILPLTIEVAHNTPVVPTPVVAPPTSHRTLIEEVIDHLLVPALRIMPQSAADIDKQNRPPVVRLGESQL
jgi:hypothetical protein